jgi:hypothetical protein
LRFQGCSSKLATHKNRRTHCREPKFSGPLNLTAKFELKAKKQRLHKDNTAWRQEYGKPGDDSDPHVRHGITDISLVVASSKVTTHFSIAASPKTSFQAQRRTPTATDCLSTISKTKCLDPKSANFSDYFTQEIMPIQIASPLLKQNASATQPIELSQ